MPRKRASNGPRSRAAREAREKRLRRYQSVGVTAAADLSAPAHTLTPRELYLREKALRANRRIIDPNHPMAQAQRQYNALLAAEAEAGRGGRPKKIVVAARKHLDED